MQASLIGNNQLEISPLKMYYKLRMPILREEQILYKDTQSFTILIPISTVAFLWKCRFQISGEYFLKTKHTTFTGIASALPAIPASHPSYDQSSGTYNVSVGNGWTMFIFFWTMENEKYKVHLTSLEVFIFDRLTV